MAKRAHGEGTAPHKWRDRWRASITIGFDARGKQAKKFVYGRTRKECLAKLEDLKRRFHAGRVIDETNLTLNDWVKEWLSRKRHEVKVRTLEDYAAGLAYMTRHIGSEKLSRLTPIKVDRAQRTIAEELSPRAAKYARDYLHNAMGDAARLGLVRENVVSKVKPIRYDRPEIQIWSAQEVEAFLSTAQEASRYYALFYTAITTGLRPGELYGLYWDDVEGSAVHVQRTVTLQKSRPVLGPPKTKLGRRVIHMPEDTLSVLGEWREQLQHDGVRTPYVFATETGNMFLHSNVRVGLLRVAKRAEVRPVRPHDLRHTFASMAIAGGWDVMRLSRHLGHADPSFTLKQYGHIFEKHRPSEALSLDALLGRDGDSDQSDQ